MHRELLLRTTVRRLLAHHSLTIRITALAPGRFAFAWAMARVGKKTRHPLIVTVAATARRPGTRRVTLRLHFAAIRMLRGARRGVKVAGAAVFVPRHGTKVKTTRAFRLRR
jgi:hypothetical protein